MLFRNSKKNIQRRLNESCSDVNIFIQVHYVRERDGDRYKFNILTLKDDPEREKLAEWLAENGNPSSFSELCHLFQKKSGKDETHICDRANLDKNYFSKMKDSDSFQPTKGEAISLCLAMRLNIEEARALLKSAGYALTNSKESDLVVRYFIENKLHHINDLKYVLDALCETSLELLN